MEAIMESLPSPLFSPIVLPNPPLDEESPRVFRNGSTSTTSNISSDRLTDRLITAVHKQDIGEVKKLLSEGAPITAVDRDKQNLLDIVCSGPKNEAQVSLVGVLIAGGLKKLNFDDDESCAVLTDCRRELKLKKDHKRKGELKRQKSGRSIERPQRLL